MAHRMNQFDMRACDLAVFGSKRASHETPAVHGGQLSRQLVK